MRWEIEIIYSRLTVRRKGFYLTRLGDETTREASVRKTAQKNIKTWDPPVPTSVSWTRRHASET
jgi:hypothetical protein